MDLKTFGVPLAFSAEVSGTLSTSTVAYIYIPCDCRLLSFAVWLEGKGDTSGSTTVVLKNGSTTLHSGVSIAYDAADPYVASETFASTDVDGGTWITAEVSAIPGGTASSGLHVQVVAVGLA